MRWCCTVFKTGAIQKTIASAFKDKSNILSFQGIRHNESASRSKYERESESPKISKQTVASPIIDWIDYDVWLYILTTKIDFNYAYRLLNVLKGNDGCMYFGELSQNLHNALISDPKPYRRDVKQMLANLLSLIEKLGMEEIVIDRPNYSQRVMLKK